MVGQKMPDLIPPQHPLLEVTRAPRSDQWLHEIKFDGYRIPLEKEPPRVEAAMRRKRDRPYCRGAEFYHKCL